VIELRKMPNTLYYNHILKKSELKLQLYRKIAHLMNSPVTARLAEKVRRSEKFISFLS